MVDPRADDVALIKATRSGDHDAFDVLVERWLSRAYDSAAFVLASPDDAAGATADGFEHLWRRRDDLDPASFGAALIQATRRAALGRLAAGASATESIARTATLVTRDGMTAEEQLIQSSRAAEAMEDPALAAVVRSAGVAVDPADRSLLLAHLRDGVTVTALGEDTGLAEREMDQRVFRMRARYRVALEARVLWRSGYPSCPALAELVGTAAFDAELATRIIDHAESCTACRTNKRLQATPAALLTALPDAPVDAGAAKTVRSRLGVAGLAATGVALDRNRFLGPDATDTASERNRRGPALVLAGIAALIALVVVLAVQPWGAGSKSRPVGVGGASDGSSAQGSIRHPDTASTQPAQASSTTRSTPTTREGTEPRPSLSTVPPPTSAPPPTGGVVLPSLLDVTGTTTSAQSCTGGAQAWMVKWQTSNATAVTVTAGAEQHGPLPGTASTVFCLQPGPVPLTLVLDGPGGQVTEQVTQTVSGGTSTTVTSSAAPAGLPLFPPSS